MKLYKGIEIGIFPEFELDVDLGEESFTAFFPRIPSGERSYRRAAPRQYHENIARSMGMVLPTLKQLGSILYIQELYDPRRRDANYNDAHYVEIFSRISRYTDIANSSPYGTSTEICLSRLGRIFFDNPMGDMPRDEDSLVQMVKEGDKRVRLVQDYCTNTTRKISDPLTDPYLIAAFGGKDEFVKDLFMYPSQLFILNTRDENSKQSYDQNPRFMGLYYLDTIAESLVDGTVYRELPGEKRGWRLCENLDYYKYANYSFHIPFYVKKR